MVVFLFTILLKTPPTVSIPKLNGITSKRTALLISPEIIPACIAAPLATTSSGLILHSGSLLKIV